MIRAGWLALFGPAILRKLGVDYPQRAVLEFAAGAGATVDVVDDGVEAVKVTIGASGGASYPAGVTTWLNTPSSANLAGAMTDETGTGLLVFHNSPTFTTPLIWNAAGTFKYTVNPAAIVANRTLSLPLLTANDTFCTLAFAQTLTNKSIDATANTLTNIGNAAISASAAIAVSKIAPSGTSGWVLTTVGGVAVWAAPAGSGGLGTNVTSGAGYIAIGATPATSGALRLTNGEYLVSKDAGGNDRLIAGVDASGYLQLGPGFLQVAYGVDDLILSTVFGQVLRASSSQATFAAPLSGALYGAVDGLSTIAISTANIALSQAQYGAKIQKFTGAPAAARTITYPLPASDALSYTRVVWVNTTTANNITISVGSGFSVVYAGNVSVAHTLLFTPLGVVTVT